MITLPKPKNDYLVALSTPHGIMQHTMYNLPDPEHGYATDDNARALLVAHLWKTHDRKKVTLMSNLETGYLRFLKFAQSPDGQFYCYVSFDLHKSQLGTGDWFGRSIFALAFLSFYSKKFGKVSWDLLMKNIGMLENGKFSIHTTSFLILAIYYMIEKNKREPALKKKHLDQLKKNLKKWARHFKQLAKNNFSKHWSWPENKITYDNGKIIQAYLLLGSVLGDEELIAYGKKMLDFYTSVTLKQGYFRAIGNKGFWVKDGKRPAYDEQVIEAYSQIAALVTAYKIFKDRVLLKKARLTYRWFWGKNRLKTSLVDRKSGAVYDGLRRDDLNTNQGAESYLALNLAYFALSQKINV